MKFLSYSLKIFLAEGIFSLLISAIFIAIFFLFYLALITQQCRSYGFDHSKFDEGNWYCVATSSIEGAEVSLDELKRR